MVPVEVRNVEMFLERKLMSENQTQLFVSAQAQKISKYDSEWEWLCA